MEEFIDTCHQATCSDLTLMEGLRVGLDEEIQFVMPRGDPSWSLAKYITFALWIAGSSYKVGEMEAAPESSPDTAAAPSSRPPTAGRSTLKPTGRFTPQPSDDQSYLLHQKRRKRRRLMALAPDQSRERAPFPASSPERASVPESSPERAPVLEFVRLRL